jgi:2-phospho-L-lactate guanylyltransferase (CobY/MobA/RfbA family)
MTFGFGEDSFRRHLRLARGRDIEPAVARLPGIGLDVDTPDDLAELIRTINLQGLDGYTARYLDESGISHDITEGLLESG